MGARYKHLSSLTVAALLWWGAGRHASAGDFKVIANPSVSAAVISAEDLSAVFLRTKTTLGGTGHVEPVVWKGSAAADAFTKQILGKSETALDAYYRVLIFTGRGLMPKAFASEAEVIAYVSRTKGAIACVSAAASARDVKTLEVAR